MWEIQWELILRFALQPVQMKLAPVKPSEPTKKITVASAFNNEDSDDDDEEEMPVKYSRNIGRYLSI